MRARAKTRRSKRYKRIAKADEDHTPTGMKLIVWDVAVGVPLALLLTSLLPKGPPTRQAVFVLFHFCVLAIWLIKRSVDMINKTKELDDLRAEVAHLTAFISRAQEELAGNANQEIDEQRSRLLKEKIRASRPDRVKRIKSVRFDLNDGLQDSE